MAAFKKDVLLRDARMNRVVVCDELDFTWDEPELRKMAAMWQRGTTINIIAKHFGREDQDEVLIALIHLGREGKIKQRKGGLFA